VKLADFGTVRKHEPDVASGDTHAKTMQVIGTEPYMAPGTTATGIFVHECM
jgi:hypothetical protein